MKTCPKCGIEKAHDGFPKDATKSSGYSSHCKACAKEKKREWLKTVAGKANRKRRYERRKRTEATRERSRRQWASRMNRSPEKVRARGAVKDAMEKGSLVRLPCEACGDPKSEAHHEDYSKRLEVRFLCQIHHREAHSKI